MADIKYPIANKQELDNLKQEVTQHKLDYVAHKEDYANDKSKIEPKVELTNLLANNNFENATGIYASNSTFSVANNECSFTASATSGRIQLNFTHNTTDKFYVKASIKTDSNKVGMHIAGKSVVYHSGSGEYENVSQVYENLGAGALRISDYRTSDWTEVKVKKIVVLNLTNTLGIEPAKDYIDELLSQLPDSWFTGTTVITDLVKYKNKVFANVNGVMKMANINELLTSDDSTVGLPLVGKKIVFMGDSVTEFGNYPEVAGLKTGAEIIKVGIGGSCMAQHSSQAYDAFSMTNLADAIASGDWSLQETYKITAVDDNNTAIVDRMTSINWNEIDILCIAHGTNDYKGGYTFGIEGDFGKTSFLGALTYIVETILTAFPHLLIMFITPTWRKLNGVDADTVTNVEGKYLVDYIDAIKTNAEKYKLPVLDMYRTSGINKFTESVYIEVGGDVHPSVVGYKLFGEKVGAFLLSHF